MSDRVLNMPLDCLSHFALILRGICENVWYISSRLQYLLQTQNFSLILKSYSTWKYNIQVNGSIIKMKEKSSIIQFDAFDLCFIFFIPMSETISVTDRSGTCFFLHASNQWHMHQMEKIELKLYYSKNIWKEENHGHSFVCLMVGYISVIKKLWKTAILLMQELRIQEKQLLHGPTLTLILLIFRECKKDKLYILKKVGFSKFKEML